MTASNIMEGFSQLIAAQLAASTQVTNTGAQLSALTSSMNDFGKKVVKDIEEVKNQVTEVDHKINQVEKKVDKALATLTDTSRVLTSSPTCAFAFFLLFRFFMHPCM